MSTTQRVPHPGLQNEQDVTFATQPAPAVRFRGMPTSAAFEERARRYAAALSRRFPRLIGCRVHVEMPHRRHQQGKQYRVRVEVGLPGDDVVVSRDPGPDETHEDVYVALRDAFRAARRELEQRVELLRGGKMRPRRKPRRAPKDAPAHAEAAIPKA